MLNSIVLYYYTTPFFLSFSFFSAPFLLLKSGWELIIGRRDYFAFLGYSQRFVLLSRRSRQRERLSASALSICLSVCLSVAKMQKKTRFSHKLSTELWSLLTTYRKLCNWAFQRTHYWISIIHDG